MLSLETARKLKEAGLLWEPKLLDCYVIDDNDIPGVDPNAVCITKTHKDIEDLNDLFHAWYPRIIQTVFIPRLDQLLAEIEARGYVVSSDGPFGDEKKYCCDIAKRGNAFIDNNREWALLREEAAAQALLWILGQEKGVEV